jgi:hypothetical protein
MDSMADPVIVLAELDGSFWLVAGEDHLDTMLAGPEGYPMPVGIIRFPTAAALRRELGAAGSTGSLWQVHPQIVARLRSDGHTEEITAPA